MTRMTAARLSVVLLLTTAHSSLSISHEDLFPSSQEEYDHRILDPKTVYGSPYGGFARASRSRLAALPLFLHGADEDNDAYMTVTDGEGREFVCKTYEEDEIQSANLKDSLFDPFVPKSPEEEAKAAKAEAAKLALKQNDSKDIGKILENALADVCTQLHQGWWSYEWCFSKLVRQFHVARSEKGGKITMESITSLGNFVSRTMKDKVQLEAEAKKRKAYKLTALPSHKIPAEHLKQDAMDRFLYAFRGREKEVATVMDTYTNGAMCDVNESKRRPRTTIVHYRCCAPEKMKRLKPLILYQGQKIASDIAAIARLEEPSTCNYELVICTPLLCEDQVEYYKGGPTSALRANALRAKDQVTRLLRNQGDTTTASSSLDTAKPMVKPTDSILDILDRTLDGVCLTTNSNQWWAYEYCHDRHVRQYHEAQLLDPVSGVTARQMESQYFLGYYDEDDDDLDISKEDEHAHVVNVTETTTSSSAAQETAKYGNGAYFPVEYIDGDLCSGEDAKSKGGIPRSTTVRYYCGPHYELKNVNEDATCHYVVDVTVPDLCHHALFRKPVDKKQVVKCLPITKENQRS